MNLLLFGGAASIVVARPRATRDIDLEIQIPATRPDSSTTERLLTAIDETGREIEVEVQAGEQVAHWSMIDWADYRDHQQLWKRFGSISVFLLEPEYFALTKLSRASATDLDDIRRVFARQHGSWRKLATVCGMALRTSPKSTSQDLFRRQVDHFFKTEGPAIWGKMFQPAKAIDLFTRSYGPDTAAGT